MEKDPLHELLFATLKEQRAKRRWGIFFKLLFLTLFLLIVLVVWIQSEQSSASEDQPHAALVDVDGFIGANSSADADNVMRALGTAFKNPQTKGVILRIDSPGGSPVQASYIYNDVMRLRATHPNIKVYAVCTDMCTSAAYYIASSANDIYANPASLVGSIGVLINGFGFVGAMDKVGVQRRLITSGSRKGFLDPFSPMTPEDDQFAKTMLDQVHQQFIHDVEQGRGTRLKITPETFSGLAWTGQQALNMGLIDGFGSAQDVARNELKVKHMVNYTVRPGIVDQIASRFGASFAGNLAADLGMGKIR